jgi:hypothetical protein
MKKTLMLIIMLAGISLYAQLPKTVFKNIGGIPIYSVENKNVFIFESGMMIDADGSPRAYHKDNHLALDYLANAGKTGNWWALLTDNRKKSGNPVFQTSKDPAPGYYISMTSLFDQTKKDDDPCTYVNSESVPYIALPPDFSKDFKLGDIALVINKKNDKQCFAIFADVGPVEKIGEGSICLAKMLGINDNPKSGGSVTGIIYILIKNSGKNKVLTIDEIEEIGNSKLSPDVIKELLK